MSNKLNILYLSNWSISEGITRSTVFPIIHALELREPVKQIVVCTIEPFRKSDFVFKKAIHLPLVKLGDNGLIKLIDLFRFPIVLRRIIRQYKIDVVWCKGSSAGGIGVLASLISGSKLLVDSFEPHAKYMVESKTWGQFSLKALMQSMLEYFIKQRASLLIPVSYKYQQALITQGMAPSKLKVLPCVVDLSKFDFSINDRHKIRNDLGVTKNDMIGIYVGKFGGLYYEQESIKLFQAAFDFWKDEFYLIILTETPSAKILKLVKDFDLPQNRILIKKVKHDEVSAFLSASDFAFSTIKSVQIMENCSAIKHGEYWAADLPIVSTLLVGDDAEIIVKEKAGCLLDIRKNSFNDAFEKINNQLQTGRRGYYRDIAKKYRDITKIDNVINFVIASFVPRPNEE